MLSHRLRPNGGREATRRRVPRVADTGDVAPATHVEWLMRAAGNKAVAQLISGVGDQTARNGRAWLSALRLPSNRAVSQALDAVRGSGPIQRQPSKRSAPALCGAHEPGEVAQSRSSGLLDVDVRSPQAGELLVVSDFGVGQSEVKDESWHEPLFLEWRSILENDPSRILHLAGYSDCVGGPKRNTALREARAVSISRLFVPEARSRIKITRTRTPRHFLTSDNLTPEHRAMNRAVLMKIVPSLNQDIEADAETVIAESLPAKIRNLVRAVEKHQPNNDWLWCVVTNLRDNAGLDDRMINGTVWWSNVDRIVKPLTPESAIQLGLVVHLRDWVMENIQPSSDPDLTQAAKELELLEQSFLLDAKSVRSSLNARYTQGGWDSASIGDRQLALTFDALAGKSQDRRAFKLPLLPGGVTIIKAKGKENMYSCDK